MSCSIPPTSAKRTSSNQDDIVVEIHTDEGISGIGETDLNAWVARACIEAPGTHTDGPRPGRDAHRPRPARPGGDLGQALRRHRHDGPPRRARACAGCARHRALGHLRQGCGQTDLGAARQCRARDLPTVRLAAAQRRELGGPAPLAGGAGGLGQGPRLPGGQARAADLGPYAHQRPGRAGRVDGRDDPRRARGRRAGVRDHGRRRLRLGRRRRAPWP